MAYRAIVARQVIGAPMRSVTLAPSLVADMAGYLRAHGVDAEAVCLRAGAHGPAGADASRRISGDVMAALWREAGEAASDPDLGLHTGFNFQPGALDIVGYVMLSSATAFDALRRGARLVRLLNDGLALDVERSATETTCRVRRLDVRHSPLFEEPRQMIETLLGGVVYQLRLLTGRPLIPRVVRLRHAAPSHGATEHARLFGVMPEFGASEDAVVLDNSDLDITLRSANPNLLTAFEGHADAALRALEQSATLSERVVREIVNLLKGEAPPIAAIARALAISTRHLQRGLAHEGTTYQVLLDEARRELAVRHLAAPDATVAKVAWLVGFSEPSAFHRAFRRWTGHSPRTVPVG